jgi:peptidoglycan-associated lipoprotein
MEQMTRRFAALLLATALAGCASTPEPTTAPAEATPPPAPVQTSSTAPAPAATATEVVAADPLAMIDAAGSPLRERTIYFEFDRSDLSPAAQRAIEAHGRFLVANPTLKLRIEGHCDERGTREYNIGLGDRRAQAVRRVLMFMGVQAAQLQTVSYGEEQPAVDGHDEAAWSRNRRAELAYSR